MKRGMRVAFGLVLLLCILIGGGYAFMSQASFGKLPEGARLDAISQSPHYEDGCLSQYGAAAAHKGERRHCGRVDEIRFFVNGRAEAGSSHAFSENRPAGARQEYGYRRLARPFFLLRAARRQTPFDRSRVQYLCFAGHFFANRAFEGTNLYTAEDMPDIDYLLISHDHWDHLDYATATALRSKVGQVVCPLGVGAHFEAWGYGKETVFEGGWYSVLEGKDGFAIHILPARHFSGRSLTRNKTLWAGFALVTPERRIFFSGDSGYGKHFAEIGARFGGFDLAMLDCGQYDENWRYVHMMPEDTAQAAEDLRARALLPGHVGKFAIAYHTWDDPFKRIVAASRGKPYRLLLPLIGEPVALPVASDGELLRWWEAGR